MEIVSIEELSKGDTILINGMEEHELLAVTVGEVNADEGYIIPTEMGGLDYTPDYPYKVVRLGRSIEKTKLITFINLV